MNMDKSRPEQDVETSDVEDDGWSSYEEDDDIPAVSPESWAPPTGPGLLASSLELGTQQWVRNEWKVVDEEQGVEGDQETRKDEEARYLLDEDVGDSLQGPATAGAPPLSRLPLEAIEPAETIRSPRVSSPRFVMVGKRKSIDESIDELWLSPSKAPPRKVDTFASHFKKLIGRWASLANAPRELWILFVLKFLSSYAYFSLMLILTTFLTDEYRYTDTAAGWTYGMYGLMSTLYGLLCGWFIDYMGVRRSLVIGAFFGTVARATLAVTTSTFWTLMCLYAVLPFSECLGIPIMSIGVKRYTNRHNRTYAFSLFYSMMNLAALCAGPAVDFARVFLRDGVGIDLGMFRVAPLQMSSLRLVIMSGAMTTGLMFLIVLNFVREIDVDAEGNVRTFTPIRGSPFLQTMEVLRNPVFWRLTLFTFLLIGVRLVFRHLDATFPKYVVRQFGRDAPYGMFYAINPLLIIFLVPMIGLVTRHVSSFSMIRYGSIIAAASPLLMCFGNNYFTVVLFMITLSIGEAIYSPRVYEYTMEVSGHGAEGLYSSLAAAPLFSVQLIVGGMSGWLLTKYMPVEGHQNPRALWAIIGAAAMTSPIFISIMKECIHPTKEQDIGLPSKESDKIWSDAKDQGRYGSFRKSASYSGRKFRPARGTRLPKSKSGPTSQSQKSKRVGLPPVYPKNNQTPSPTRTVGTR